MHMQEMGSICICNFFIKSYKLRISINKCSRFDIGHRDVQAYLYSLFIPWQRYSTIHGLLRPVPAHPLPQSIRMACVITFPVLVFCKSTFAYFTFKLTESRQILLVLLTTFRSVHLNCLGAVLLSVIIILVSVTLYCYDHDSVSLINLI